MEVSLTVEHLPAFSLEKQVFTVQYGHEKASRIEFQFHRSNDRPVPCGNRTLELTKANNEEPRT